MTAKTEIGGHLVSGHIHGTGEVLKVINRQATKDLRIKIPTSLREYFFYKGYVALDGCSLTIGKVLKTSFYIHLIPETVSVTTFKDIKKGDLINIEVEQSTINTVETVKKIMSQRKV
jgi:riboflavin synthase